MNVTFSFYQENLKFKAVMLGNAGVGKSTLASRYITGKVVKEYGPTVGGVFYKK
jgi:GTPase SAR1 family protein